MFNVHSAPMVSRFAQKVTLENLDFLLQTDKQTLQNFIIRLFQTIQKLYFLNVLWNQYLQNTIL